MLLGIVKEHQDRRVALVPSMVAKFRKLGLELMMEYDAGINAGFRNSDYADVTFSDRQTVINSADMLVSLNPLSQEEYQRTKSDVWIISLFAPYFDDSQVKALKSLPRNVLSMDMIPRTTLAQTMDVLSSMASVAGYRAVLLAAAHSARYFPMLMTAAGTIKPSKVVILGAGVAGLQAISTARRLGAVVEVFDTRAAVKEEVESLGGKFIEVEGARDDKGAGGYAVEQSEDYLRRQRDLVQEKAAKADVLITTAQVRGKKAPILVTKDTIEKMNPGSVIVDLAASTGGNCDLTQDNKTIVHQGVTIIGDSNLAAGMPSDASFLFANNVHNYVKSFLNKEGQIVIDDKNEIFQASWVTK